jgi:hypothetical protein
MTRRTEKLVAWVEPDLARQVQAAAQADDRSVSDWLRLAVKRVAADMPVVVKSDQFRSITDAAHKVGKPRSRIIP